MERDELRRKFPNLPESMIDQMAARMGQTQAAVNRVKEQVSATFGLVDSVHLTDRTGNGQLDPDAVRTIGKFQNGIGDILYLQRGVREQFPEQDQLVVLSARVKKEAGEFALLDPISRINARNSADPRFGAHLANEALKADFQRLKTPQPPRR